ncbi:hypothetical protein B0H10DRAFT_2083831 [Mycena sp. CBHHK59/15]|nr:hypothetical protein B0H10DRAFT_2083831 [Mycena sp. CBHHK59/15]
MNGIILLVIGHLPLLAIVSRHCWGPGPIASVARGENVRASNGGLLFLLLLFGLVILAFIGLGPGLFAAFLSGGLGVWVGVIPRAGLIAIPATCCTCAEFVSACLVMNRARVLPSVALEDGALTTSGRSAG